MEGPQFSSMAESKMYRDSWNCDVIGMTNMPEAKLAREAELCYASIAMVTDFDSWHPDHGPWIHIDHCHALRQLQQWGRMVRRLPALLGADRQDCEHGCDKALGICHYDRPGKTDHVPRCDHAVCRSAWISDGYRPDAAPLCRASRSTKLSGWKRAGLSWVAPLPTSCFVPIRKKGKLPGTTISEEYKLEYGEAIVEIHDDAIQPGEKILLVDDLLATGGTASAGIKLIQRLGGEIISCSFIVDLPELGGRDLLLKQGMDVSVLCEFDGL
ncbi:Adenine phosphoribosyltransferase [Nymphon striatum]|nr:Adenine phosphoribosyltransferase [Nymphon striatum]